MATLKYKLGHAWGQALTIGELIDLLSKTDPNRFVFAEWEGQMVPVGSAKVVAAHSHWDADNVVLLDASGYGDGKDQW